MNAPWKCHHCWAQNEAHATECSYCGTSLAENERRAVEDSRTKSRRKRTLKIVQIASLVIAVVVLPIAARSVWRWHNAAMSAAAVDYHQRLEKDQLLDARGQPVQCEITEEMHSRNLGSWITCTFVVNNQAYASSGPTPLNYKFKFDDTARGPSLVLAPGNFVDIVYDPQNPALNRISGDRFVSHAIESPLGLEVIIGVFVSAMTLILAFVLIWSFRLRRKTIAAILSGKDVLTQWKYSPEEWQFLRDEFPSIKTETLGGQIYITPTHILITNRKDKLLFELASGTKVITLADYLDTSPLGLLRFRSRWKTVVKRKSGFATVDEDEEFGKRDHRIPVPPAYEAEARRVSDYFQAFIEMNVAAVQNVLPRSKSLLGNDTFED